MAPGTEDDIGKAVRYLTGLQLVLSTLCVFDNEYWFLAVSGMLVAALGFYGAYNDRRDLVLGYKLCCVVMLAQLCGLLSDWVPADADKSAYDYVCIIIAFCRVVIVEPAAIVWAFRLHDAMADMTTV